jgi:hypothetical protein
MQEYTWVLRKTADLLSPFSTAKKLKILEALRILNLQGKAMAKPCKSSQAKVDNQRKSMAEINGKSTGKIT